MVHLPPSALGDVRGGITQVLNRKLMTYDDALRGAMLSYSGMSLRQRHGAMFNELPNILFEVRPLAWPHEPKSIVSAA